VYYYYFDQHLDYADTSKRFGYGSPHGQEVAYVFQHVDASKSDITKTDLAISDAMGTYWTNFAKYGHPNSNDVPVWPAFTNNNPQVMYFNKTAYPGPVPSVTSIQVLDEYFKWRRTAEGKEWAK
jgi:para-nitrobenzyl esterase